MDINFPIKYFPIANWQFYQSLLQFTEVFPQITLKLLRVFVNLYFIELKGKLKLTIE